MHTQISRVYSVLNLHTQSLWNVIPMTEKIRSIEVRSKKFYHLKNGSSLDIEKG